MGGTASMVCGISAREVPSRLVRTGRGEDNITQGLAGKRLRCSNLRYMENGGEHEN